jgi:hypothetical protein
MTLEWYIYALCWWQVFHVVAPRSSRFRVILSLTISAVAGYLPQEYANPFALQWAMIMLPVFVAGQLFPMERALQQVPYEPLQILIGGVHVAAIFMASSFSFTTGALEDYMRYIPDYGQAGNLSIVFWDECSFGVNGAGEFSINYDSYFFWLRGLLRNAVEITKAVLFLVFLCPRSHSHLTVMGTRCLFPYLLQWLAIVPIAACMAPLHSTFRFPLVSILTVVCLSSWPVYVLFRPLLEPRWCERLCTALMKREKPNSLSSSRGDQCNTEVPDSPIHRRLFRSPILLGQLHPRSQIHQTKP